MELPAYVSVLISRLEEAGYPAYAVGGCVRDALLGLTPHDYDLCTAAGPETVKALFSDYRMFLAGEKHGTVSLVCGENVVEITTFRVESGYADHRHPDEVCFVPRVEADLARRDFTVNAMAWSPARGLADPFGGREDLTNRILRSVGDPERRFREDPLRILRGARFAVRFRLTPEARTLSAMHALSPLMDTLARERVFSELSQFLLLTSAGDLALFAPEITQIIPELASAVGFDQRSPHHVYDVYTHIARVVEAAPPTLPLRWAALLHDVGKVSCFTQDETGRGHFKGHAQVGARIADGILRRLKAPTALREQVVALIDLHMTKLEPEKKQVRRWLSRLGPETLDTLLALQEADMGSKGTGIPEESAQFPRLRAMVRELQAESACLSLKDLAVNGNDLMALGLEGPEIGRCLRRLLSQVLEERLPNTREALLEEARHGGCV